MSDSSDARQAFGELQSARKSLGAVRPPRLGPGDALLDMGKYRRAAEREDWAALTSAAAKIARRAETTAGRLSSGQQRVLRLQSAADAIPESLGDLEGCKLNTLPGWRDFYAGVRDQAVADGVSRDFARARLTAFGRVEVDSAEIRHQSLTKAESVGSALNLASQANLRLLMGSAIAGSMALLNAPTGTPRRSRRVDYEALERRVYEAVRDGRPGTDEAHALWSAASADLEPATLRLAAADEGSRKAFEATQYVKEALEALAIGKMLEWRLGWPDSRLRGAVGEAQRPYEDGDVAETLLSARASGEVVAEGRVTATSYQDYVCTVTIRPSRGDEVQYRIRGTDVGTMGCVPGVWARVTHVRREGDAHVAFVPARPTAASWRGTVRQQVRSAYLGDPFALGLSWSWAKGATGAARMVSLGCWFS